MNKETAVKVTEFSMEVAQSCSNLIEYLTVKNQAEIDEIKPILGKILGETYFLAAPVWQKFPELKPKEITANQK